MLLERGCTLTYAIEMRADPRYLYYLGGWRDPGGLMISAGCGEKKIEGQVLSGGRRGSRHDRLHGARWFVQPPARTGSSMGALEELYFISPRLASPCSWLIARKCETAWDRAVLLAFVCNRTVI
jgi:hypothetical protein